MNRKALLAALILLAVLLSLLFFFSRGSRDLSLGDVYQAQKGPQENLPGSLLDRSFTSFALNYRWLPMAERIRLFVTHIDSTTSLQSLDEMAAAFINDTSMSRREKVALLWKLAGSADELQSIVVLDLLKYYRPVEIADEMIASFEQWPDRTRKLKILDLLRDAGHLERDPETLDAADLEEFREKAPRIQSFLRQTIARNDVESAIVSKALESYIQISSVESALEVLGEFSQGFNKQPPGRQNELLLLWTDVALSNPEIQSNLVGRVLEMAGSVNPQERGSFDRYLYSAIRDFDLTAESKKSLSAYLAVNKPEAATDSRYYHWMESYAKTSLPDQASQEEKNRFVFNFVMREASPEYKASVLIYADEKDLQGLSRLQIDKLRRDLSAAYQTTKDPGRNFFYSAALEVLDRFK